MVEGKATTASENLTGIITLRPEASGHRVVAPGSGENIGAAHIGDAGSEDMAIHDALISQQKYGNLIHTVTDFTL